MDCLGSDILLSGEWTGRPYFLATEDRSCIIVIDVGIYFFGPVRIIYLGKRINPSWRKQGKQLVKEGLGRKV